MKNELIAIKSDANKAKVNLFDILRDLEDAGLNKDAEVIEELIIKLEVWQNS